MKKRIIATVLTAACALTGCSTSVPDLSKLDAGKASEYMAGELLKHDSKYAYGLDYDRSILNPTPTPTPIVTPAPAPTETAAVQSAEPGQAAAGKDGEAEVITVPLTKLYGIPGVSVDFVSAKLKSSLGADYAYCKVGKGKKLLVLYFRITCGQRENRWDFYSIQLRMANCNIFSRRSRLEITDREFWCLRWIRKLTCQMYHW